MCSNQILMTNGLVLEYLSCSNGDGREHYDDMDTTNCTVFLWQYQENAFHNDLEIALFDVLSLFCYIFCTAWADLQYLLGQGCTLQSGVWFQLDYLQHYLPLNFQACFLGCIYFSYHTGISNRKVKITFSAIVHCKLVVTSGQWPMTRQQWLVNFTVCPSALCYH